MHNIDRTNLEMNYGEFQDSDIGFEFESDQEQDEYENFSGFNQESPFSEAEEMDLAAELLTIQSEAELDQFIGNLVKKGIRGLKKVTRSPIFGALGQALKGVAKQALPALGSAVGNVFLPGVGGVVGGKLASAAGRMFGLELESLSEEDQEFEVARGVIRLAGAAANNVAQLPTSMSPQQAVQTALTEAAKAHAPGLLRGASGHRCHHKSTGRWVRRGRTIILIGA